MTQAKIDLKKLRERVADKDNPPHSDALKQSAWELLICCDPTGLRSLLDALDETRAALEFYADRENWWKPLGAGWASALSKEDCAMWNAGGGRARLAIAKLEEKFA